MKILVIYFFLLTFWITYTTGFSLAGVKGLSLANLSLYFLFVVWAINIVLKRRVLEWNSVNTYLILLIFAVIVSIPYKILLDEIPYAGLKKDIIKLKNWIEPFLIFFTLFNIIDDKKTCKRVLFGLGTLLLITSLSGPLASFNIIHLGRSSGFGRAAGLSLNSNEFAAYLVIFIPMTLTFALFHKSNIFRIYGAIAFSAASFALIFSGSRGGIISCAASIFSYLFMLFNQKVIRLRTLLSVATIILMVSTILFVLAPSKIKKMVSSRFDPTEFESVESFSSGRWRFWRHSISLFAEKPIFGHGYQAIQESMNLQFGEAKVAHNQYLNYLVELGIIGCTLFILIFAKIFHIIWKFIKITPDLWEKKLSIGYIAGLLGYTFSMLFSNMFESRQIFWFYTAVFLRYVQLQEIGEKNHKRALTIMKKDTVLSQNL